MMSRQQHHKMMSQLTRPRQAVALLTQVVALKWFQVVAVPLLRSNNLFYAQ